MYYPYADIHISENGLIFYSENNKSGCSTIKKSIGAKRIPYGKYFSLHAVPIFSVVRNPYSRFLSSFRYCCLHRSTEHFKNWSPSECTIENYLSFLESTSKNGDFAMFDRHQRPQSYNLCINKINYNFIGKLEHLKEVFDYLSSFGYKEIKIKNDHRTGAIGDYKNKLDGDHCRRIQRIFEEDFEAFKYSYDLASTDKVKCLNFTPNNTQLDKTFKIKVLIESLYIFHGDEKFQELIRLNMPSIAYKISEIFRIPGYINIKYRLISPLIFLMILSGSDFKGRLEQILLSLVQSTDFNRNLEPEDIDLVIQWCENNEFDRFLDTLINVRKNYHHLQFETQYLHWRTRLNYTSLEINDESRFNFAPSIGIAIKDI